MKQLVLSVLFLFALVSCQVHDRPPKTDHLGPVPAAHDGVFVDQGDTLFFNGDGTTIRWSFSSPIESLAEKGEGTYVFKLYNGSYRYDAAEEFCIHDGKKSHNFMTGPQLNTEDKITFIIVDDDDKEVITRTFTKLK
ncbi:MAG: hypothetical protein IKW85_04540 [Muribaculaceae bacterium]|nr:hypothetical protein [Muribaculaceae bacterium]